MISRATTGRCPSASTGSIRRQPARRPAGRLGMTVLPGKHGASTRYPGRVYRRDLERDLAGLAALACDAWCCSSRTASCRGGATHASSSGERSRHHRRALADAGRQPTRRPAEATAILRRLPRARTRRRGRRLYGRRRSDRDGRGLRPRGRRLERGRCDWRGPGRLRHPIAVETAGPGGVRRGYCAAGRPRLLNRLRCPP